MVRTAAKPVMVMHDTDNVAVCIRELRQGELLRIQRDEREIKLKVKDSIPLGHKIALQGIDEGKPIIKYGEIIGKSTRNIVMGQHVHTHNITDYG
jgi:altronate dehydratase small subunit